MSENMCGRRQAGGRIPTRLAPLFNCPVCPITDGTNVARLGPCRQSLAWPGHTLGQTVDFCQLKSASVSLSCIQAITEQLYFTLRNQLSFTFAFKFYIILKRSDATIKPAIGLLSTHIVSNCLNTQNLRLVIYEGL